MRNRMNPILLAALALGLGGLTSPAVGTEGMPPPPPPPRKPRRTELDEELMSEPLRPPPGPMAEGCRWTLAEPAGGELVVKTLRRYREPGSLFDQPGGTSDAPPRHRASREKKLTRKRQRRARRRNR